jgi:predicted Zn-dependent protease
MMRTRPAVLLTLLVAVGCASYGQRAGPADTNAWIELGQARHALEQNEPERALAHLERARTASGGRQSQVITLMLAEIRLHQNDAPDALSLASSILEHDGSNAAAREIAGKALLKLGRFRDAEDALLTAQAAYQRASSEYQQLEDLVRLARGLDAYAQANPSMARQRWEGIQDPELRSSLERAVRSVSYTGRNPAR